jgi:hypothetical protein
MLRSVHLNDKKVVAEELINDLLKEIKKMVCLFTLKYPILIKIIFF